MSRNDTVGVPGRMRSTGTDWMISRAARYASYGVVMITVPAASERIAGSICAPQITMQTTFARSAAERTAGSLPVTTIISFENADSPPLCGTTIFSSPESSVTALLLSHSCPSRFDTRLKSGMS